MADATNALMRGDTRRRFQDKLARLSVTGGGLVVLFALLLIFFYLAYVVFPLFKSPDVTLAKRLTMNFSHPAVQLGLDDNNQLGFRYSDAGNLTIFSLQDGKVVARESLADAPTSFAAQHGYAGLTAYGLADGKVSFQRLRFISSYKDGQTTITPDIERLGSVSLSDSPIPVTNLTFADNGNDRLVAGVVGDHLQVVNLTSNGALRWHSEVAVPPGSRALMTPNGRKLFLLSGETLQVYALTSRHLSLRETVNIKTVTGERPQSMALLAGGHSLMVRLANGQTGQWFDVVKSGERSLTLVRTFDTEPGLAVLEPHRNVFANLSHHGALSIWHAPSESQERFAFPALSDNVDMLAFSPGEPFAGGAR